MTSHFDQNLQRNAANFAALSPLGFFERSASIYPSVWPSCTVLCARPGRRLMPVAASSAHALQQAGIGKNDTVAVILPNTPPMIEAHFGVPMAGAVLNALNTRLDPRPSPSCWTMAKPRR